MIKEMDKYIYCSANLPKDVSINGIKIGNNNKKVIIAGPCTFGSYEELYDIAKELKKMGIKFLRAGAYKARTDPYSFQGLRDDGIEMLLKIKEELKLNIVTELMTLEHVKKYGNLIDVIQVGSRNMYNYELLKEIGKLQTPVLLKRGLSATYDEWLLSAEYILKEGNKNVILCERGVRNIISNETRNILDLQAIPYIKNITSLPIIVDPSHASGKAYMVESMSKAALVAGADGLIIEAHINPENSLSDGEQTINLKQLQNIIEFNESVNI
jgi:3-deoxy-7-phosphoheptulonate synthase